MKQIHSCIIGLFIVLLITSCGYRMGSLTPTGIRTISVPIMTNDTLFRLFEVDLTKAVVDEIVNKTNLVVVKNNAETTLYGRIISIKQGTVVKDANRQNRILSNVVGVQIEWIDNRTNRPILPKRIIRRSVEVNTDRGENFDAETTEAFQDLARLIVFAMESPIFSSGQSHSKRKSK